MGHDFIQSLFLARVEFYCDADRRSAQMAIRPDEVKESCPTIEDALEVMTV